MKSSQIIKMGSKLPYGAKKEIAKITGLHYSTVFKFFKYGISTNETKSLILEASKPFLEASKETIEAQENIINIGNNLPYGAKKEITKVTGLSDSTVIDFFKYGTSTNETKALILEASKPFLEASKETIEAQENIINIGNNLPYGAKKEIAKVTGLTQQTINNFFKVGKASPENTQKILEASNPYFEQNKDLQKKYQDNVFIGQILPHGAKEKIAEITGISKQTISKFFKTGKATAEITAKILEASKPFAECSKNILREEMKLIELLKK